jgi:hypothetical protein
MPSLAQPVKAHFIDLVKEGLNLSSLFFNRLALSLDFQALRIDPAKLAGKELALVLELLLLFIKRLPLSGNLGKLPVEGWNLLASFRLLRLDLASLDVNLCDCVRQQTALRIELPALNCEGLSLPIDPGDLLREEGTLFLKPLALPGKFCALGAQRARLGLHRRGDRGLELTELRERLVDTSRAVRRWWRNDGCIENCPQAGASSLPGL